MKPRRIRDHRKPQRRPRHPAILRFGGRLTLEQIRAIEKAWADKAGRPAVLELTTDPLPLKPWWRRWFR